MPGPWNDATERQLLLNIIHLTAPQLPKWEEVAKMMGEGFTESTRQHFQKMRKDCKAKFGEPNGEVSKSTPRKPKASATNGETPTKSTGKRKGRKNTDGTDDDESGSPSKKAVKKEETEDGS